MHRRRSLTPIAASVAGILLLAGCSGLTGLGGTQVSDEERHAYESALAKLKDDAPATEAELEAFLEAYPDSPLADDAAEQLARIAFTQGREDDAFRWLYLIVEKYPDGDRVDSARLRLARWEARRSDFETARRLAERVRPKRLPRDEQRSYYRLLAAMAEDPVEKLGHLAELRWLLAWEVQEAQKAEGERPVADESAGEGDEEEAEGPAESAVLQKHRETLERVDTEIDALLYGLSDHDLMRAAAATRGRVPAGRIRLLLARRALDAGDMVQAESLLKQAKRHDLSESDQLRVESLELRLGLAGSVAGGGIYVPTFREAITRDQPDLKGAVGTVGVVLPLSGRLAPFGRESLRGVLLAAGIFDYELPPDSSDGDAAARSQSGSSAGTQRTEFEVGTQTLSDDSAVGGAELRVVVRDTRGSPERAAAAVREFAEDEQIVAIVGPIFREESEAAAREAERAQIPLLTLSSRQEISSERDHVFRLRTTPDDEVRYLVDYAMDVLGAKSFAVLYPRSRYGRGMRTRYWDAVRERGGQLVAAASYEPDATDFNSSIRSMIGYSLLTNNEKIALNEREQALRRGRRLEPEDAALLREVLYGQMGPEAEPLPPVVDFDALFIPDSHEKIQLIAPQLAFHEIGRLQLLGSSDWNHPDLVKVARKHVQGAVISTPFFVDSEFEAVQTFVRGYRQSFGQEPDSFSAHAYDATHFVMAQLAVGNHSRTQLRDGILRLNGYPGVSGVTTIRPDGNASKRPFLLGVRRGSIVGLD